MRYRAIKEKERQKEEKEEPLNLIKAEKKYKHEAPPCLVAIKSGTKITREQIAYASGHGKNTISRHLDGTTKKKFKWLDELFEQRSKTNSSSIRYDVYRI